MEKLNIFLLFPENDDEILAMGEDTERYKNVVKDLTEIKNTAQNVCYTLFYDSNNIDAFCNKAAEIIVNENYLNNIKTQLLNILNKKAINVVNKPLFKSDCCYFKWNSNTAYPQTDNILRSATEDFIEKKTTIVISFLCQDEWNRDIIPIIKDAPHYKGLPIIFNIPYFNTVASFVEWYRVQNSNNGHICLCDVSRFERTNHIWKPSKRRIYKEKKTGNYWYYDYFHKDNKEHYEVFDSNGNHLGEADITGELIVGSVDNEKSIKDCIN
ncbi:MAG: hypothetical protein IKO46_08830 [Salinivirgaceae bacterium]|nr:hypothetical protein [Salinivirgaceae bacterium]MBR6083906.1 hypothetical protein [Salinivirgaceae bacterium]